MVLSQAELISKAAGLLALGYASWSHFPQLLTVWAEKPTRGGLSWKLLVLWILADAFSLLGVTLGHTLQTQIFQFTWYLIGDSLLTLQQAFFQGYLPFTQRRRQRKADEHGASRALVLSTQMTKDSPWSVKNQVQRREEAAAVAVAAGRRKKGRRAAQALVNTIGKRPHGRREEHVELLPAKPRRRGAGGHSSDDESEEELRSEQGPRGVEVLVIHLFGRWNSITQPICLVIMTSLMILVWYLTAYRPRASLAHLEHPSPPIEDGKVNSQALVAWILASIGTALNNIPRVHQLYITVKVRSLPPFAHRRGLNADLFRRQQEKSTEGVEPYMFIALSKSPRLDVPLSRYAI
ncbi:hypothetical protein BCR35DRAFT_74456 [Leucosporidium creatinivorum]|uniref:PQ loop repeat-domain-containing protein n=1 Tax=Leucosporidium creatinivorum TaxID=106004 RepID=A0A1Y2G4J5_9BASI|nr:hypothetical protein BCR35DRAFT_74456 [Leucosporidium creatinivorum]